MQRLLGVSSHDVLDFFTFQSDLYQLGIVLLSLLMGKPPIPLNANITETAPFIRDATPRRWAEALIPAYGQTARMIGMLLPRTVSKRYASAQQAHMDFYSEYARLQ